MLLLARMQPHGEGILYRFFFCSQASAKPFELLHLSTIFFNENEEVGAGRFVLSWLVSCGMQNYGIQNLVSSYGSCMSFLNQPRDELSQPAS
jgi:hypothetical protein